MPTDETLPAGAIQPEAPQPVEPVVDNAPPSPPAEVAIPLSQVLELLRAAPAPSTFTPAAPPPPPALAPDVANYQRFISDPAWRAHAIRQVSNGALNPEDPVHIAFVEQSLENRAARAQLQADMARQFKEMLNSELDGRDRNSFKATVQGAFEAELGKHANLSEGVQTMLANNVGMLVQGGMHYAQAIRQTFATIQPLVSSGARAPAATRPAVLSPGSSHTLAAPGGNAGKGGEKLGGRAGLQAALANIRASVNRS